MSKALTASKFLNDPSAGEVSYTPAGTGAVVTTVQSKLRSRELTDYAALRAFTSSESHVQIIADGIAGVFNYDSTDTTSADNGGTIIVDITGRRWKRLVTDWVNPEWFQPAGRWNDDDTIPVQTAINFAALTGKTLILPKTYTVGLITLPPNTRINGTGPGYPSGSGNTENLGAGFRTKQGCSTGYLLSLADQTDQTIWNRAGVFLSNFKIYGDKSNQTNLCGGLSVSHAGGAGGGGFIPRHKVDNLVIQDCNGTGFDIGPFTRDSSFTNLTIYGSNGFGVHDAGVDGLRANWNIGQSFCDGLRSTANAVTYVNMKVWGSGQYNLASVTNPLIIDDVTGTAFDATTAVNYFFWKNTGIAASTLKSQESTAQGFRIEGQGTNLVTGFVGTGFESDGDCRMNSVSGTRPGINIFRAPGILLQAFVGKLNPAFVGGPYNGIQISTSSEGGKIDLVTSGVTSYVIEPASGGVFNDWSINGHKGKLFTYSVSVYTPNPYEAETHLINMIANLTINNPGRKPAGFKIKLIIVQDAIGGRTITFGADFQTNWTPSTTANKTNIIEFMSNGTNWIQTASAVGV